MLHPLIQQPVTRFVFLIFMNFVKTRGVTSLLCFAEISNVKCRGRGRREGSAHIYILTCRCKWGGRWGVGVGGGQWKNIHRLHFFPGRFVVYAFLGKMPRCVHLFLLKLHSFTLASARSNMLAQSRSDQEQSEQPLRVFFDCAKWTSLWISWWILKSHHCHRIFIQKRLAWWQNQKQYLSMSFL